jgi:hypothetical protein
LDDTPGQSSEHSLNYGPRDFYRKSVGKFYLSRIPDPNVKPDIRAHSKSLPEALNAINVYFLARFRQSISDLPRTRISQRRITHEEKFAVKDCWRSVNRSRRFFHSRNFDRQSRAEILRVCRAAVSGSMVNHPMLRFLRPGKSMPWWRLSYFRTRIRQCLEKY